MEQKQIEIRPLPPEPKMPTRQKVYTNLQLDQADLSIMESAAFLTALGKCCSHLECTPWRLVGPDVTKDDANMLMRFMRLAGVESKRLEAVFEQGSGQLFGFWSLN